MDAKIEISQENLEGIIKKHLNDNVLKNIKIIKKVRFVCNHKLHSLKAVVDVETGEKRA